MPSNQHHEIHIDSESVSEDQSLQDRIENEESVFGRQTMHTRIVSIKVRLYLNICIARETIPAIVSLKVKLYLHCICRQHCICAFLQTSHSELWKSSCSIEYHLPPRRVQASSRINMAVVAQELYGVLSLSCLVQVLAPAAPPTHLVVAAATAAASVENQHRYSLSP